MVPELIWAIVLGQRLARRGAILIDDYVDFVRLKQLSAEAVFSHLRYDFDRLLKVFAQFERDVVALLTIRDIDHTVDCGLRNLGASDRHRQVDPAARNWLFAWLPAVSGSAGSAALAGLVGPFDFRFDSRLGRALRFAAALPTAPIRAGVSAPRLSRRLISRHW
jgi:hypothetical protein